MYGTIRVLPWDPRQRIELRWAGQGKVYYFIAAAWGLPTGLAIGAVCLLTQVSVQANHGVDD